MLDECNAHHDANNCWGKKQRKSILATKYNIVTKLIFRNHGLLSTKKYYTNNQEKNPIP